MNELTPIEKLDNTLNYLVSIKEQPEVSVKTILRHYQEIENVELVEVLNKLVDDGYVYKRVSDSNPNIHLFKSNFNGRFLMHTGGYKAKISKDNVSAERLRLRRERQDNLEEKGAENSDRLNKLTRWLVIVSAFLAIIQIVGLILPYFFSKEC